MSRITLTVAVVDALSILRDAVTLVYEELDRCAERHADDAELAGFVNAVSHLDKAAQRLVATHPVPTLSDVVAEARQEKAERAALTPPPPPAKPAPAPQAAMAAAKTETAKPAAAPAVQSKGEVVIPTDATMLGFVAAANGVAHTGRPVADVTADLVASFTSRGFTVKGHDAPAKAAVSTPAAAPAKAAAAKTETVKPAAAKTETVKPAAPAKAAAATEEQYVGLDGYVQLRKDVAKKLGLTKLPGGTKVKLLAMLQGNVAAPKAAAKTETVKVAPKVDDAAVAAAATEVARLEAALVVAKAKLASLKAGK